MNSGVSCDSLSFSVIATIAFTVAFSTCAISDSSTPSGSQRVRVSSPCTQNVHAFVAYRLTLSSGI